MIIIIIIITICSLLLSRAEEGEMETVMRKGYYQIRPCYLYQLVLMEERWKFTNVLCNH